MTSKTEADPLSHPEVVKACAASLAEMMRDWYCAASVHVPAGTIEKRLDRFFSHPEGDHPDDAAVDRFAVALKAKLAKKRNEGRGGWDRKDECSAELLSRLLREHVEKGDPVDVGNLAMMLHQRGERIS